MTKEQVAALQHGLYIIYWKEANGGGHSMAAVGSDSGGRRWYAATNWITVPSFDWRPVSHVGRVCTSKVNK